MPLEVAVRLVLIIEGGDTIKLRSTVTAETLENVVRQPILDDEQRSQIDSADGVLVVSIITGQVSFPQQTCFVEAAAVEKIHAVSGQDLPVLAGQPGLGAADEKKGGEKSELVEMHGV